MTKGKFDQNMKTKKEVLKLGYTHHFDACNVAEFSEELLSDVRSIVHDYYHIISMECDSQEDPIVDRYEIRFNGIGELGYETFLVGPGRREFCKTAEKPYDLPVCEVLLVLLHHYGKQFELRSDGFWVSREEFKKKNLATYWNDALKNIKEKFGYEFELMPKISNEDGFTYYSFDLVPI